MRKLHVNKFQYVRLLEADKVASLLYVHKSTVYRWINTPEQMPKAYRELLEHKALGVIHHTGYEHFIINDRNEFSGPNGFSVSPEQLEGFIWSMSLFYAYRTRYNELQDNLEKTLKALESANYELEKLRQPCQVIPLFGPRSV